MIRIGICDDNTADAGRIETLLLEIQKNYEDFSINIFYSGEKFCKEIKECCPFDIVFMDIEMGDLDGITVGEYLRANDENDAVLMIYISSYDDYFYRLFDVQPYSFISKPIDENEFFTKVNKAVNKVVARHEVDEGVKFLPVSLKGKEVLFPMKQILYLESRLRKIYLHTLDNKITTYYGTLNDEENKFSLDNFVRTHQSYIVNLNYVKEFTSDEIILINNSVVPISSRRRQAFNEAYLEYRRNYFD